MAAWFLWTIAAVLSWGIWAVLSKLLGDSLSGPQSQALSTLGSLPVMVGLAFSSKTWKPEARKARGIIIALLSGLVSGWGNIAYYQALASGAKAATVVPLTALSPIVTIALAMLLLSEKLNRIQAFGVCLSLGAIYLFNVPNEKGFVSGALGYAIVPLILWGICGFLQKLTTAHISGELSAFCFLAAFVPLAFILLAREPVRFSALNARTGLIVTALGFFLAAGNVALLIAFARNGKASIISPLAGLYPLISVPIAIGFLGERIGVRELGGIILAILSVVALSMESKPAERRTNPVQLKTNEINQ